MPLYTIAIQKGVLTSESKASLAAELTTLHETYAGVPRNWVHVVFQEYAPGDGFSGGVVNTATALTVSIRTGRSPEYKRGLLERIWKILQTATGAPDDQIAIGIEELPASQAMEMASIMPDVDNQTGAPSSAGTGRA